MPPKQPGLVLRVGPHFAERSTQSNPGLAETAYSSQQCLGGLGLGFKFFFVLFFDAPFLH